MFLVGKRMNMKVLGFLLSLFMFVSCAKREQGNVPVVRFDLSEIQQMKQSDFIEDITLIPLETNDSSLLKNPQDLSIHDDRFVVHDGRGYLFFFGLKGQFLSSTKHLQGVGPNTYQAGLGFTLLSNGEMEVFDALGYKLLVYDEDLKLRSVHKLPLDVLPAEGYLKINDDLRVFYNRDSDLKFYSLSKQNLIEKSSIPFRYRIMDIQNVHWQCNSDGIFYSGFYAQDILYSLNTDELVLEPYYKFDFGNNSFNVDDLPDGMDRKYYQSYIFNTSDKAFVADKYVDDERKMCFFIYDKKLCFAYYNEETQIKRTYYNIFGEKGQLPKPLLYKDDIFYAVCEPSDLSFFVDESLLSLEEKEKMRNLREDDNPIVVCYKLK